MCTNQAILCIGAWLTFFSTINFCLFVTFFQSFFIFFGDNFFFGKQVFLISNFKTISFTHYIKKLALRRVYRLSLEIFCHSSSSSCEQFLSLSKLHSSFEFLQKIISNKIPRKKSIKRAFKRICRKIFMCDDISDNISDNIFLDRTINVKCMNLFAIKKEAQTSGRCTTTRRIICHSNIDKCNKFLLSTKPAVNCCAKKNKNFSIE